MKKKLMTSGPGLDLLHDSSAVCQMKVVMNSIEYMFSV